MYSLILKQFNFNYNKDKISNIIIKAFEKLYNELNKNNLNKAFITFV